MPAKRECIAAPLFPFIALVGGFVAKIADALGLAPAAMDRGDVLVKTIASRREVVGNI